MKLLKAEQWNQSRIFLQTYARELDKSLAQYYFWGGSAAKVRDVLQTFQNHDGGFGRAIEPDFRLEESSSLGTTVGLQYAREISLGPDDPMIQAVVQYLLKSYDFTLQRWHAVPKTVNDVPHAPWWTFDTETGRCGVEGTWANPSAEILGYLWEYQALVPSDFLISVTEQALSELNQMQEKIELHDFLCYQRLAQALPALYRETVVNRLLSTLARTVDSGPEQWENYGAKPLQIAPTPSSVFAEPLREAISANLDYEIDAVNEDGSWSPNWSWFGQYEEDWTQAEVEWKGVLTVKNMKSLYDYGRVESLSPDKRQV